MYDQPDLTSSIDRSRDIGYDSDTDTLGISHELADFTNPSFEPRARHLMRSLHLYSSKHWGYHVELREAHVTELDEFLETAEKVHVAGMRLSHTFNMLGWFPTHFYDTPTWGFSQPGLITILHLAAYLGLDDFIYTALHLTQDLPSCPDILARVFPHQGPESRHSHTLKLCYTRQAG